MAEAVRREEAVQILRRLDECRFQLKKGQLHGCLHAFRDALERIQRTPMIAADEKMVLKAVNSLQQDLGASPTFKEEFGPVSFRDGETRTSLDFVRQLLQVREDEMSASLTEGQDSDATEDGADSAAGADAEAGAGFAPGASAEERAREALALVEGENEQKAREFIQGDGELLALILQVCNTEGIACRKAGQYDRAIREFRKALVFHPRDEGLHYNIARAFLEKRDWKEAEGAILEGLKVKPDFQEGKALLKYIRTQAAASRS